MLVYSVNMSNWPVDIRSGFADVLDTLQWVDGVGAAEDAGSEHNGEGVGRHPVSLLLQGYPVTHHSIIQLVLMLIFREYDAHANRHISYRMACEQGG